MEPAEVPSQISKDNFLEVPNLSDSICDDEEVKATVRPGFSPQPSRRSSESSEDTYLDNPASGSRRVSFADSLGFNLVSIKEFDSWELPSASTEFDLKKDIFHKEEYVLSPLFDLPSSKEEVMRQLQVQKAILETTEYLPGSTSMKGIIRVLNMSFEKLVYVRMSLDDWKTHYDILAEYVPNSCDGETDQFSFKISLVPPYQKDGSKVEFCIRYETSVGTFWSNNNGTNYILICQKRKQEPDPGKQLEEVSTRQIRGCLKVKPSSKEESSVTSQDNNFENSNTTGTYIPTIICSHEDMKDLGTSHQNVKDINRQHDEHNEKDSDLMINQHVIYEKNKFSTDPVHCMNKTRRSEKMETPGEGCAELFKRPLSLSSSAESSFKGEVYYGNRYTSGSEGTHQPLEEIKSDVGETRPFLGDTGQNEFMHLDTISKEVLDDNANPAHEIGRTQIPCAFPGQIMAGDLDKNPKEGTKKIGIKDWEYVSIHGKESNVSHKDDYGKGKVEKDQKTCLDVNEKQSQHLQLILHDQERKMGHPTISMEETAGHKEAFIGLPSKDHTVLSKATTKDQFSSIRTKVNWEGEHATIGQIPSQVGSPQNESVLRDDYLLQVDRKKSDFTNTEDENKNTQHQNWNVLESPGKGGSKRNITEQIKEQGDCKGMQGKRDNMSSLKSPPTEQMFTCQETDGYELSSLADGGITQKAQAVAAYIIKTTLESTSASMSARGNGIIAQLPPETARSDRPTEVKETAFDPHEGRNDDSHYNLCQRASAGIIHDKDFLKESHLDICNIHVGEMEKEETMSTYHPGKRLDRETGGFRNTAWGKQSSQVSTGKQQVTSKLDSSSGVLSTDKSIFIGNRAHGQAQELSRQAELDAVVHSAFNLDTTRAFQSGSQAITEEKTVTTMMLQSIPSKTDYNCNPTDEIQGQAVSKPKDVSTRSDIMPGSRKQRHMGQIFQGGEFSKENSLGPMILTNEPLDNVDEVRHENEGSMSAGQSRCSSGDKGSESCVFSGLAVQESQGQRSESVLSKYINSKIPYCLLFLIFLVTIYYYDLMIGLAFYLFSLYWLYWEGGRQKESIKKK
uniref:Protein phosphatase 1 regulatory subunit 3A n=1 Tax=Jaculus jaculus TaxID=51337 RepID=A0A8C5KS50_JACJA